MCVTPPKLGMLQLAGWAGGCTCRDPSPGPRWHLPPHVRLQQAHACKNKTFLLSLLPAHSSKS